MAILGERPTFCRAIRVKLIAENVARARQWLLTWRKRDFKDIPGWIDEGDSRSPHGRAASCSADSVTPDSFRGPLRGEGNGWRLKPGVCGPVDPRTGPG